MKSIDNISSLKEELNQAEKLYSAAWSAAKCWSTPQEKIDSDLAIESASSRVEAIKIKLNKELGCYAYKIGDAVDTIDGQATVIDVTTIPGFYFVRLHSNNLYCTRRV